MKNDSEAKTSQQVKDALIRATRPKTFVYPLVLMDGTEIELPCHICSHVMSLQAQKGLKILEKDDIYDPTRDIELWIRKTNMGLNGGWKFIDDSEAPKSAVDGKDIPISLVTTDDWVVLPGMLFPGSELSRKSVEERRDAILRQSR